MITLNARTLPGSNGTLSRPPAEPAHLSASSIKDYLGCSLRYYFRKVVGLPDPGSINLHLGSAVHAALQAHFLSRWRGEEPVRETSLGAFNECFDALVAGDAAVKPDDAAKKRDLGVLMVETYLDSEHCRDAPVPVAVEVALREDFARITTPLVGQVDLVVPDQSGEGLVPVDFKTVANQPDLHMEGFLHEAQLVLYQLLVESATGGRVSGREIVFITKHKVPRIVVHRVPRASDEAIERFWQMAGAALDGIREERFYPQPGTACAWCAFKESCSRWTGEGVMR